VCPIERIYYGAMLTMHFTKAQIKQKALPCSPINAFIISVVDQLKNMKSNGSRILASAQAYPIRRRSAELGLALFSMSTVDKLAKTTTIRF